MRREAEDRFIEGVQCSVCGEADGDMQQFVLCDGGDRETEWFTGAHEENKHGWHYDCISAGMLGAPKEEVFASPDDQPWCCTDCVSINEQKGKWLGWKITEQKVMTGLSRTRRQHYLVHWLGSSQPSWQPLIDVQGAAMHRHFKNND